MWRGSASDSGRLRSARSAGWTWHRCASCSERGPSTADRWVRRSRRPAASSSPAVDGPPSPPWIRSPKPPRVGREPLSATHRLINRHAKGSRDVPEPIEVRKIPLKHVSDASGLAELIDAGVIEADRVIAVIGKTEGNGGVNDYTRIIADRAFREVLVARGSRDAAEVAQVP